MKHLFVLIILVVAGYVAWQVSDPETRKSSARFLTKHGIALGAILVVLLSLVATANYLPSQPLL